MNVRDPPWNQSEKVELLTEIIRAANVPPEKLLPIVNSLPSPPPWTDMPLPRGRTVRQCQTIYATMVQPSAPSGLIRSTSVRQLPRPLDIATSKRPFSMEGPASAPSTGTRYQDIQPKPPGLTSLLNPASPGEPPKKKRGRPTKVESEMRKESARARGEHYPILKREPVATTVTGPLLGVSLAATQAARAVMTPPPPTAPKSTGTSESSSGKRKRGRPSKAEMETYESADAAASGPDHGTPSRGYPDILSRDPQEPPGPSSFRAPR